MTEQNDNPDPRVEQMLRRWGNQEAAGSAEIGRPPGIKPPRLSRESIFRWAPLAAAAVLLIVSLIVLVFTKRDETKIAEQQNEIATLESENTRKDKKYAESDKKLVEKEQAELAAISRAESAEAHRDRLQKNLASAQTENTGLAAEMEVGGIELKKMQEKIDAMASLSRKLTEQKKVLELRITESADTREVLVKNKNQLAEENRRLRSLHLTTTEKLSESNKELTHLRSQRALVLIDARRLYLDMIAHGDTGVSGLQKAIHLRRTVEQCGSLKTHLQSDSARELFGRLEVALIRLEMLDVTDNAASGELTRIVRGGQIIQRIDKVLEQGTEPADIRSFLFEVRLILMGGDNVS